MLQERQYGEIFTDGSRREPEATALSGKPFVPGDVQIAIAGTPYFVTVKATEWSRMTPEEQAALRTVWKRQLPRSKTTDVEVQAALSASTAHLDYEARTAEDLRVEAQGRGIDLTGVRSKPDIIAALRAEDVRQRFTPSPALNLFEDTASGATAPEGEA